jgi:hypothetical protein
MGGRIGTGIENQPPEQKTIKRHAPVHQPVGRRIEHDKGVKRRNQPEQCHAAKQKRGKVRVEQHELDRPHNALR